MFHQSFGCVASFQKPNTTTVTCLLPVTSNPYDFLVLPIGFFYAVKVALLKRAGDFWTGHSRTNAVT